MSAEICFWQHCLLKQQEYLISWASSSFPQFKLGWFANPIFGSGDYPQIMKETVLNKSMAQGYNESRLPEFLPEEIDYIRGK